MAWTRLGQILVIDAGFPLRCVTGWRCFQPDIPANQPMLPQPREAGFIEFPARNELYGPEERWIPYYPLWPGLIGNALVWGGVIWVGLFGLRLLRGRRRRRHGLCTRCAYDRKGIATAAPCPECGTVPASA